MALDTTLLPPRPAQPPALVTGGTVLAMGVVPGMDPNLYGTVYAVESITSAANVFGTGRFTRALGELMRQKAPSILAIGCGSTDDFSAIFDYMAGVAINVVVPVGLTATGTWCDTFSNWAWQREQRGMPLMVVMSADPSPGVSSLVSSPVYTGSETIVLDDGSTIPASRNLVLTLDQVTINPNVPSQYTVDAAPSVAGLIAATPPNKSLTYAQLQGLSLVNPYSAADAQTLSNAGYLTLQQTLRHGIHPLVGVTATSNNPASAYYSASYHRLSTLRTSQYVVAVLQDQVLDMVGDPTPSNARKRVTDVLDGLQSQGVILAYSTDISISEVNGQIDIQLAILPPYETTMISVTAQVNMMRS